VSNAAKILIVDDTPLNVKLLADRLSSKGYRIETAGSGAEALDKLQQWQPDLVLLDVVMPEMNGYEVCRRIRDDMGNSMLPVVMITALDPDEERVKGLDAGADDFLTKPVNMPELEARVRSLLRVKGLYDKIQVQSAELEEWNAKLETRVHAQVEQLENLGKLRRFLSPQVADLIISSGDESVLDSHRSRIAALFCDLRGFTHFSETAEPEDVIEVLQTYHEEMGRLIYDFEGTIDHRAGDGIMAIFNDPLPCDDPPLRAVQLAVAMRDRMTGLTGGWRKLGHELGFGVGVSVGYATLGLVGFEGRFDYCANGSVVNLAARLSDEASDGQILISQRTFTEVDKHIEAEEIGERGFKGFSQPVGVLNIIKLAQ
jgi:class 3 adenylate cyclase